MRAVASSLAVGLLLALAGCATPPPAPAPEPPPPPPPPPPVAAPACPTCDDQNREIARLRQELAQRDAEVRDLRGAAREQVRVVQETARESTRAKARARRLATQAEAASYLAEVEVLLQVQRAAAPRSPLVALAQRLHDAASEPFALGDYGLAMDRAAQAEQLLAAAADARAQASARPVPLQPAIPLVVGVNAAVRRDPLRKAKAVATLPKGAPIAAVATNGTWLRVTLDDGRTGWVDAAQAALR
ncbi:MAG: SH3 domain-containing protein [Burkholderiales bacterium]